MTDVEKLKTDMDTKRAAYRDAADHLADCNRIRTAALTNCNRISAAAWAARARYNAARAAQAKEQDA